MTEPRGGAKPIPLRRPRKCPICGQPSARENYPFCSRRCADIDLSRWLSGRYVISGKAEATDQDEPPASE